MESACRSLEVFDFKEEDQLSEIPSARFTSESRNSNALDKYKFLENFDQGTNIQSKEIVDAPCLVVAIENDQNCDNVISCTTPPVVGGEVCTTKGMSGLDADMKFNSPSHEQHPHFIPNKLDPGNFFAELEARASSPGAASPSNSQVNCALLKSPSSETFSVNSDADGMKGNSPATSDIADDVMLDRPSSIHFYGSWEMGKRNMAVDIRPDYIVYHDRYCPEPELTFSNSCINIKCSTTYGNQGSFTPQFRIDDIIDIESQWLGRNGLAMVKVRAISKGAAQAENVHSTSGIEELEFAVVDSDWCEKQEAITSLHMRYKDIWNVVFETDMGKDGEGQNSIYFPKSYFPNFSEPFEEVIYPKGDSDAVSISKRDVDLLRPDTFVNDTVIDFYIKYLKNKIQPEERHRFHFFNSFFFRKLADLDKDPSSAFEGRAAFQRVRKWTRKVNLFEKDYIFIPVNFNYHWSLIVICHPGEVAEFEAEHVEKSLKVPCILHMDSIKGSHTGLKDLVQSYLWEEWKERRKETDEDISSRFLNLRFVPLELPQQQNSFDCGLFLLHYVECFLEDAPVNFSPFKITKFSNFLNIDWFPPEEASLKRALIWRLIYELQENHSQEISPASCDDKPCTSNYPTSNEDVVMKHCTSNNLLSLQSGQGIEITLLPTSSPRSRQCASDAGLFLREFFKPGATAGSFLDGHYRTFDPTASFNEFKGNMTPIEQNDIESGDHLVYPSTQTGYQLLAGVTPEVCALPCSNRDFGSETFWNLGISSQQSQNEDIDLSPETSISASSKSLEVDVNENSLDREDSSAKEKTDKQPRSPSTENVVRLTESFASAPTEMLDVSDSGFPDHLMEDSSAKEKTDKQPRSPSTENVVRLTESFASAPTEMLDVSDSGFPDHLIDSNGNADPCPNSLPRLSLEDHLQENVNATDSGFPDRLIDSTGSADPCPNSLPGLSLEGTDVQENVNITCDVGLVSDESDVQQAAKRLRLTPPEEEQKLTRSLSEELHL